MEVAYSKELTARGLQSPTETPADVNELQNLKEVIRAWRELNKEVSELNAQLREKRKRQKALEEVILRIMKKNTIGALDLTGSGGRIIYRRKTSKGSLNIKSLTDLLAQHLKSETAAGEALKYILENRGATVKESILYEKEQLIPGGESILYEKEQLIPGGESILYEKEQQFFIEDERYIWCYNACCRRRVC